MLGSLGGSLLQRLWWRSQVSEKKKRQREMDGDLGYLAGPMLGMVFSEQALRSVGRSVVDRGFCSEHMCSPQLLRLCSGNPNWFAMGSTWEEVNVGAWVVEDPIWAPPQGP